MHIIIVSSKLAGAKSLTLTNRHFIAGMMLTAALVFSLTLGLFWLPSLVRHVIRRNSRSSTRHRERHASTATLTSNGHAAGAYHDGRNGIDARSDGSALPTTSQGNSEQAVNGDGPAASGGPHHLVHE